MRWKIENQGFNLQKNSGLNLEHAYSTDPDVMKSFYYLMQIAHLWPKLVCPEPLGAKADMLSIICSQSITR